MRTVVGLFQSGHEARRTIEELAQLGFAPQSIGVITNVNAKSAIEAGYPGSGFQNMNLTDVGAVVASGPLAALETASERAGLAGMLQRLGLSSDLAAHYCEGVERGGTLESLTVDDGEAERVAAVMKRHAAGATMRSNGGTEAAGTEGGTKRETGAAGTSGAMGKAMGATGITGAAGAAGVAGSPQPVGQAVPSKLEPGRTREKHGEGRPFAEEERTIPVYREELSVGKREVERGGVRVTTHVVEKPYAENVVLRDEHVEVERRPADRLMRPGESRFQESQIEVAEMGEEAAIVKQTRLVEEVVVHKRVAERTATVGDTLRSTEVDVRPFEAGDYRSHFEQKQQKLGGTTFEEHAPAYRFGEGLGRPGSRWDEIEADARARWEAAHPGTWERFKESIRHAWSRGSKPEGGSHA